MDRNRRARLSYYALVWCGITLFSLIFGWSKATGARPDALFVVSGPLFTLVGIHHIYFRNEMADYWNVMYAKGGFPPTWSPGLAIVVGLLTTVIGIGHTLAAYRFLTGH